MQGNLDFPYRNSSTNELNTCGLVHCVVNTISLMKCRDRLVTRLRTWILCYISFNTSCSVAYSAIVENFMLYYIMLSYVILHVFTCRWWKVLWDYQLVFRYWLCHMRMRYALKLWHSCGNTSCIHHLISDITK